MNKMLRPALAFLAAVILLGMLLIAPKTKAEDPTRDSVSMLILYDDSFAHVAGHYYVSQPWTRITQMMKLAVVPFEETLGMTINLTVASYSSVIGTEYAKSCPDIYPLIPGSGDMSREQHYWEYYAQCECVDEEDCYLGDPTTCHHNSAYGLIERVYAYAENSNYDYVALYVGHTLCYYAGDHYYCAGMSQPDGMVFIGVGHYDIDTSSNGGSQPLNLLSLKGIMWHEFGHNLGLDDPNDNYTTTEPCAMAGGFDGIVYARNIWCEDCMDHLTGTGGE